MGFQCLAHAQQDSTHFVTTWRTTNPGISDPGSILISTSPDYEYNFDIDWNNDGIFDDLNVTSSILHHYETSEDQTIRIRGTYPKIEFEEHHSFVLGERLKLISVD